MAFEKILPIVVAILYLITGVIHIRKGQYAMGSMWLFYAAANVSLVCMKGS